MSQPLPFDPHARPDDGGNPFVGPRSLQTGESLYGRNHALRKLRDQIIAHRAVLLYASSGAGKSSLIQAGLIPVLEADDFQLLGITRVNIAPVAAETMAPNCNPFCLSIMMGLEERLPPDLRLPFATLSGLSLRDYFGHYQQYVDPQLDPLVVIDQFEEVFRLYPEVETQRIGFFKQLAEAMAEDYLWFLFSMREEFLAPLEDYAAQLPTQLKARYRLGLLELDQAAEAITLPFARKGIKVNEDAKQALLKSLSQVRIRLPRGRFAAMSGTSIEPVQLQIVCHRMYEGLPEGTKEVTLAHLQEVGDLDASVGEYFRTHMQEIAKQTEIGERVLRDWVVKSLITKGGIRTQILMGKEASAGLKNLAVHALLDAHLLRVEPGRGALWLELAHDRLVNGIVEDNRQWREANLTLLEEWAELWDEQDRPSALLIGGRKLDEAKAAMAQKPGLFSTRERDFLKSCKTAQAQRRRRRLVMLGTGIVLTLAALITFFAHSQARLAWKESVREQKLAEDMSSFFVHIFEAQPEETPTLSARELLRRGTAPLQFQLHDNPELRQRLLDVSSSAQTRLALHQEAASLRQDMVDILCEETDYPALVDALNDLVRSHLYLQDIEAANAHMHHLWNIQQTWLPNDRTRQAETLLSASSLADALEQFQIALDYRRHSLEATWFQAETPLELAGHLEQLCKFLIKLGKLDEAEALLQEISILHADNPNARYTKTLMQFMHLYRRQSRWQDAESVGQQALAMNRKILPKGHQDLVTNVYWVGYLQYKLAKYSEAEEMLGQMYQQLIASGRRGGIVRSFLNMLGKIYEGSEQLTLAAPLFESLLIAEGATGFSRNAQAPLHSDLAKVFQAQNNLPGAEVHLRTAFRYYRQIYPLHHAYTVTVGSKLAQILLRQEKYEDALHLLEALVSVVSQTDIDSKDEAMLKAMLGYTWFHVGCEKEGRDLLEKIALDVQERTENSPQRQLLQEWLTILKP